MKKLTTFILTLLKNEEDVKCFICTTQLKPMEWNSRVLKALFFWLPDQHTVGFVRPTDIKDDEGRQMVSMLEIVTCLPCGEWCREHPLEGETLAHARLNSLSNYK